MKFYEIYGTKPCYCPETDSWSDKSILVRRAFDGDTALYEVAQNDYIRNEKDSSILTHKFTSVRSEEVSLDGWALVIIRDEKASISFHDTYDDAEDAESCICDPDDPTVTRTLIIKM